MNNFYQMDRWKSMVSSCWDYETPRETTTFGGLARTYRTSITFPTIIGNEMARLTHRKFWLSFRSGYLNSAACLTIPLASLFDSWSNQKGGG